MSTQTPTAPSADTTPVAHPLRRIVEPVFPDEVLAKTWASCDWCHAVRQVSKFRYHGPLRCQHCREVRPHSPEFISDWNLEAAWMAKLLLTAGLSVNLGPLAPLDPGKPTAVTVTCRQQDAQSVDRWRDSTPVYIDIALNKDLTPWGLGRAMRAAWNHLSQLNRWSQLQWDDPASLSWNLSGKPGDVDAAHRLPQEWVVRLFAPGV